MTSNDFVAGATVGVIVSFVAQVGRPAWFTGWAWPIVFTLGCVAFFIAMTPVIRKVVSKW